MVFKCQEDSFLKEFTSKAVSCEKCVFPATVDGKKIDVEGYKVILENTILFPEGGGQPSDRGYLNDQPVYQVVRKADQAIHYVAKPVNVGEDVKQVVDWDRRLDHMQQHSGQHLITGVLNREFNYDTISWWLGEEVSYIELDTPLIKKEEIKRAEEVVNELIRAGKQVTVEVYKEDISEDVLKDARSVRGLPDDHKGDIRVINIEDVERNMCCGTHVTNLCQLQVVKLLHAEKSKRKGNTLLYFLVGNRVTNRLAKMLDREEKITVLLNNGPNEHVNLIEKLHKNTKISNKNLQAVLKDLAIYEANRLKNTVPTPKYFSLHRKEADPDFMNIFLKELGNTDVFLFLSTGEEKGVGNILLYGDEKAIENLGNKIAELLNGKGAGKGRRFQAKVSNMGNRAKAEEVIKSYLAC